ncbi:MAG: fibronectin type III domain-containing protein, partial [Clostridia bacterium]|nr:fibronectin type III domain-containing protein [Clostridia bacterium]
KAKAGIVYYYSVRVCKDGERSEGAKGYALILAAPTNVKASKSGSNIKLTFTPSKGAASHYIYRKTGNGSWKQIAKAGKSATSYTDKTAGSGTNYYYVQAISGGFKSPKSATVSIKK